ncbi:hypothetical protein G9P44_004028 [Scheffersomyces stipitis]|nr:hypothetical protein G9P44_004028 [Scheffersomyces stipitis]
MKFEVAFGCKYSYNNTVMKHHLKFMAIKAEYSCEESFSLAVCLKSESSRAVQIFHSQENHNKSKENMILTSKWMDIVQTINSEREFVLSYGSRNGSKIHFLRQFADSDILVQRFTATLKVLKILLLQAQSNSKKSTTIRDIYYQDVEAFHWKQRYCNEILNSIVVDSLGLSLEHNFSIYPSQKGLVYGDFAIKSNEGTIFQMSYSEEPVLIPLQTKFEHILPNEESHYAIVILEKEAVFQSFCYYIKTRYTLKDNYVPDNLIVVTGKGFPDNLTKKFVNILANTAFTNSVTLGFFDSDVYGINICKNYQDEIATESKSRDIYAGVYLMDYIAGWSDITARERILIMSTITKITTVYPTIQNKRFHRELTRGLWLSKKCEMNVYQGDADQSEGISSIAINEYILSQINSHKKVIK